MAGPAPPRRSTRAARRLRGIGPLASDGFLESLGADVVHFPYQSYAEVDAPTVYNPHDLQHRHHPEFFTADQLKWRETVHSAALAGADAVAAESRWAAGDVVREYGVAADRIHVIARGAPTELYPEPSEADFAAARAASPAGRFVLYPAASWPHKNHLRLVEALALVRDRDRTELGLVCTGHRTEHWDAVAARVRELGLDDRRSPCRLRERGASCGRLYRLAEAVVVPSLFEGGGFPVLEAFREQVPVACSNATALPEVGGDAVVLFDPLSIDEIAGALSRLTGDAGLRETLVSRGTARLALFRWDGAALAYRSLYRSLAGGRIEIPRGE